MNLKGKVVLITGGGQGIGSAIAERFVADGAKICITGRVQEKLDKVAASLPAGSTTTCSGDVTKFEDAKRMVDATISFGGKIDVLVNNAAIDPGGSVVDIDPALWRKVLEDEPHRPVPAHEGRHTFHDQERGRLDHKYRLPRRSSLPARHARIRVVKSGPHHAHPAGRAGLRPG